MIAERSRRGSGWITFDTHMRSGGRCCGGAISSSSTCVELVSDGAVGEGKPRYRAREAELQRQPRRFSYIQSAEPRTATHIRNAKIPAASELRAPASRPGHPRWRRSARAATGGPAWRASASTPDHPRPRRQSTCARALIGRPTYPPRTPDRQSPSRVPSSCPMGSLTAGHCQAAESPASQTERTSACGSGLL